MLSVDDAKQGEGRAQNVLCIGQNVNEKEYYQRQLQKLQLTSGVTSIGAYAFAECRKLVMAEFPAGLVSIGRHAFYNCRGLRKMTFGGPVKAIEDGAFRNCEGIHELVLAGVEKENVWLKMLLPDLEQELTVTIAFTTGETAILLLPKTSYEFVANEPARMFSEVSYGAGHFYRQCVGSVHIDLERYDSLFEVACREESFETVVRIAIGRLSAPYQLSEKAQEDYRHFLNEKLTMVLTRIAQAEDWDKVHFLIEKDILQREHLEEGIRIANETERPYLASLLMDAFHNTQGAANDILEL